MTRPMLHMPYICKYIHTNIMQSLTLTFTNYITLHVRSHRHSDIETMSVTCTRVSLHGNDDATSSTGTQHRFEFDTNNTNSDASEEECCYRISDRARVLSTVKRIESLHIVECRLVAAHCRAAGCVSLFTCDFVFCIR